MPRLKEKKKRPHPNVHNFLDLTGQRFGRLIAVYYVGKINGKPSWKCECDCGNVTFTPTKQLTRRQTQSCGCLMIERTKQANTTHGRKHTRVYRIWSGMLNRCRNLNSKDYHRYGGSGISVCNRWLRFESFYKDMGDSPSDVHSIDRKDGTKGYCKSNCRWATAKQQASNRRRRLVFKVSEKTMLKIIRLRTSGMPFQSIANVTGVSKRHVMRIAKCQLQRQGA